MIVSIFGDIDYGDRASLLDWIQAHDYAHQNINQALLPYGATLQTVLLSSDTIDNDWFGVHGLSHVAIARTIKNVSSESAALLATNVNDWDNEPKFKDWHQAHDQLHSRINAALGISA